MLKNPFPGPVSLTAEIPVFGRDDEIASLTSLLLAERVVVLHGISGAGKSSLLSGKGGVCDQFRNKKNFSVLGPVEFRLKEESTNVYSISNGQNLYETSLVELLLKLKPENESEKQLLEENIQLTSDLDLELFFMRRDIHLQQDYHLLVIDQFEDIFTRYIHDEEGKITFFQSLGRLIENNTNIWLLLAMREEFLAELDHYKKYIPNRLGSKFRLELLRKNMAAEAIIKTGAYQKPPVHLCKKDVKALVENLSEVAIKSEFQVQRYEPGFQIEPLFLQLVCNDAWKELEQKLDKANNSIEFGPCFAFAPGSNRNELNKALAKFYETALKASILSDKTKVKKLTENAREYRIRAMIQDGLISQKSLRNLLSYHEIESQWGVTRQELKKLLDMHIVRLQERNLITYYELAHDRIVDPIKINNSDWFRDQEDWRKAARARMQGEASSGLFNIRQFLKARSFKKLYPDLLCPYEAKYIELDQKHVFYPALGMVAILIFFSVATFILMGTLATYAYEVDDAERKLSDTKKEFSMLKKQLEINEFTKNQDIKKLQEEKDKIQEQIDATRQQIEIRIKNVQKVAGQISEDNKNMFEEYQKGVKKDSVNKAINSYQSQKWRLRDDQGALLAVIKGYEEANKTFDKDSLERKQFDAPLFSAFNTVMTSYSDRLGFVRSIPFSSEVVKPIAYYTSEQPLVAYLTINRQQKKCIRIESLRVELDGNYCFSSKLEYSPPVIRFFPDGKHVLLISNNEWKVLQLDKKGSTLDIRLVKKGKLNIKDSPKSAAVIDISQDGELAVIAKLDNVVFLCRKPREWQHCASGSIPNGQSNPVTSIEVSHQKNGESSILLGMQDGSVSLDKIPIDLNITNKNSLSVIHLAQTKVFNPPKIESPEEPNSVVALALIDNNSSRFLKVHMDSQVFLVNPKSGQGKEDGILSLVPDKGSIANGILYHPNKKHLSSAVISEDHFLYTIVDDSIYEWDVRSINVDEPHSNYLPVAVIQKRTSMRNFTNVVVGDDYLIGNDLYQTWVWERNNHLSKLVHQELPGTENISNFSTIFYPQSIKFGTDNELFSGSTNYGIQKWIYQNSVLVNEPSNCRKNTQTVRKLDKSPDGRFLAAAMSNKTLMTIDIKNIDGQPFCNSSQHTDGLWAVAFSPDNKWLISGEWKSGGDKRSKLILWERSTTGTGELIFKNEIKTEQGSGILSAAFSPHEENENLTLAIGTTSGDVILYYISSTGKFLNNGDKLLMSGGIGQIKDLEYSPDGTILAAAGSYGPIQLWLIDVKTQNYVVTDEQLLGHSGGTNALAFNPDKKNKSLVSGGADGSLKIWAGKNYSRNSTTIFGAHAGVLSVAWNDMGKALAASFTDESQFTTNIEPNKTSSKIEHGKILIWNWNLDEIYKRTCNEVWYPMLNSDEKELCESFTK